MISEEKRREEKKLEENMISEEVIGREEGYNKRTEVSR